LQLRLLLTLLPGIVSVCEQLQTTPYSGTRRDDIRPNLRITNYRKRTVIAFSVDAEQVSILGVFYGDQDYEAVLQEEQRLSENDLTSGHD